jgi:O-antigen/teichoic acid export membrane protein
MLCASATSNLVGGNIVVLYHEYQASGRLPALARNILTLTSALGVLLTLVGAAGWAGGLVLMPTLCLWVFCLHCRQVLMSFARARGEARRFAAANLLLELSFAAIVVTMVLLWRHVTAHQIIAARTSATILSTLPVTPRQIPVKLGPLDRRQLKDDLAFNFPVMIENTSATMLASLDRVLMPMLGVPMDVVGVYATTSSVLNKFFSLPLNLCKASLDPILYRWWASRTHSFPDILGASSRSQQVLVSMFVLLGCACFAIRPDLLNVFVGTAMAQQAHYADILILGTTLYCVGQHTERGLMYAKRTSTKALSFLSAAMLGIIMSVVMIPLWGVWGCAITSATTYGMDAFLRWACGRRFLPIRYTTHGTWILFVLAAILAWAIRQWGAGVSALVGALLLFGTAIVVCFVMILRTVDRMEHAARPAHN